MSSTSRVTLIALLRDHGHLAYGDEGVTQLQHSWQCARLARQDGAAPMLELAAWLHDVGHLLTALPGAPTRQGQHNMHEAHGAKLLRALFGRAVVVPVALHVAAKRYLVTTTPGYRAALSADSLRCLALQGGPMSPAECARFVAADHAADAMQLRRWDDMAKNPDLRPASTAAALADLCALMERVDRQATIQRYGTDGVRGDGSYRSP